MKNILSFDDFLSESVYVSPQEKERKQREAEMNLRSQIKKITTKIKEDPKKSEIYKIELDIVNSKLETFSLMKQLKAVKERYAKTKKK
jgi:hypothetical protein